MTYADRAYSLSFLLPRMLQLWPLVICVMAVTMAVAAGYGKIRARSYDVDMVVGAASQPGQRSGSNVDLGAAAGLLGVRANLTDAPNLDRYKEVMTSVELAQKLDPNGPIFRGAFVGSWDAEAQKWRPPQGGLARWRQTISEALGGEPWHPPTPFTFAKLMRNELAFSPVGRTTMLRIALRTGRPDFAVQLLTALNDMADTIIRDSQRARVAAYRDFLSAELPTITNQENRQVISQLLLEQERQFMMLNANSISYVAEVIDPPSVPDQPNGPGPLMLIAVGGFAGLVLGLGLAYVAARRSRDDAAGLRYIEQGDVEFRS